jgi:hypothetical protein
MSDELSRAYASLAAFAAAVPADIVGEQWAKDFNVLLDRIGPEIATDLSEFKVTSDDLYPYRGGFEVRPGRMAYRLNQALNYINLRMPEQSKRQMGFSS